MQHVRRWFVIALIAGCNSSKAPAPTEAAKPAEGAPLSNAAPAPPKPPVIELVEAAGQKLRFLGIESGKVVERRTVGAPGPIAGLYWSGRDLVVALGELNQFLENLPNDVPNDVKIGVVTATGVELVPLPPRKQWTIPRPKGTSKLSMSSRLYATASEIWLGRCEWGHPAGGGDDQPSCNEWVYARVRPGPVVTSRTEPTVPEIYPEPEVAAPAGYQVELVPAAAGGDSENKSVRCTHDGKASVIGDGVKQGRSYEAVRWLSIEPPVFQVRYTWFSEREETSWATFEGCAAPAASKWPKDFEPDTLVPGPNGLYIVRAPSSPIAMIMWQGRHVLTLDDAGPLEFVPPRP